MQFRIFLTSSACAAGSLRLIRHCLWHDDVTWQEKIGRDRMPEDGPNVTRAETTGHDVTERDMTWHDVPWHAVTWRDVTWRDMTWHDMTWHAVTCRDVTRHDMSRHETWNDMTLTNQASYQTRPQNTLACTTRDERTWHAQKTNQAWHTTRPGATARRERGAIHCSAMQCNPKQLLHWNTHRHGSGSRLTYPTAARPLQNSTISRPVQNNTITRPREAREEGGGESGLVQNPRNQTNSSIRPNLYQASYQTHPQNTLESRRI